MQSKSTRATLNSHSNLPLPPNILTYDNTQRTPGISNTLFGTAQNSTYICYLRAACLQAEYELIKALLQIFQVFLQSLPRAHCTPPRQQPQWRPSADIPQDIFFQLFHCTIPLTGQDLPWTVLTKLYRPLHIRTSSVVTEQYFFPQLEDLGFMSGQ